MKKIHRKITLDIYTFEDDDAINSMEAIEDYLNHFDNFNDKVEVVGLTILDYEITYAEAGLTTDN